MQNGLVLASVVRILHDDWPIRLGENRPDRVLKHLSAVLSSNATRIFYVISIFDNESIVYKLPEKTNFNPMLCCDFPLIYSKCIPSFM